MSDLHRQAKAIDEHLRERDDTFVQVIVERNVMERIRCEKRDDRVVFVFDIGRDIKTVVDADLYLGLLNRLRDDPKDSQYGIPNDNI